MPQVEKEVRTLKNILKAHQISIPIRRVIVLVNASINFKGPTGVYVVNDKQLVYHIKQLSDVKIDTLELKKVLEVLSSNTSIDTTKSKKFK